MVHGFYFEKSNRKHILSHYFCSPTLPSGVREASCAPPRTAGPSRREQSGSAHGLDGVARSWAASQPPTGSGQELRGGEEESADGVQVGAPLMDQTDVMTPFIVEVSFKMEDYKLMRIPFL